jgi:cyclic pyranopterin phosphate synthase
MNLPRPLLDRFGRLHSYLRISVTDRCNYRCLYCMPEEGLSWIPRQQLLSYEEIARIVSVVAPLGIRRVRLTGGEPTVRRDILELVGAIGRIPGIDDLSITTNGQLFGPLAESFKEAGLKRVNISLDSLDLEQFSRITRGGSLKAVIHAVEASLKAGLAPVKINMVVCGGEGPASNLHQVLPLSEWCLERGVELRFIEYMPFGDRWHTTVSAAAVREKLGEVFELKAGAASSGGGPAKYWEAHKGGKLLRVGFISPLTEHFCASCNRLRLLADGDLRTCLAHEKTPNLRNVVRGGASDAELEEVIRLIVRGKPAGHEAQVEGGKAFEGVMTAIGG